MAVDGQCESMCVRENESDTSIQESMHVLVLTVHNEIDAFDMYYIVFIFNSFLTQINLLIKKNGVFLCYLCIGVMRLKRRFWDISEISGRQHQGDKHKI